MKDRELHRAKRLDNGQYMTSDSSKWEDHFGTDVFYLREATGSWVECDQNTRAVSFPDQVDANKKRVFSACNESRKGGDILNGFWKCFYFERVHTFIGAPIVENKATRIVEALGNILFTGVEVTGIYEGEAQ